MLDTRYQKRIVRRMGHKMVTRGLAAYPEDWARWAEKAKADRRPLNQWLRNLILAAEEKAKAQAGEARPPEHER